MPHGTDRRLARFGRTAGLFSAASVMEDMMRFANLKAIALATAFVAPPLAAQAPWNSTFWEGAPAGVWERVDWMQHRIDAGVAHHRLNRAEAARAQDELGRIREITRNLRDRDGGTLSEADRTYVQDRLDQLGHNIHWMAHNGW
jgi:hypothetical protein